MHDVTRGKNTCSLEIKKISNVHMQHIRYLFKMNASLGDNKEKFISISRSNSRTIDLKISSSKCNDKVEK